MAEENVSASGVDFWLEQAEELKSFADSCWSPETLPENTTAEAKLQGLMTAMLESSPNTESELKWLYGNLMAFAIQYLSIGILIRRNPQRFLNQVPGNRIVELAEECGVEINHLQKRFLKQIENTFKWGEKFPKWNVPLTRDQLVDLAGWHTKDHIVSLEEKKSLDKLFEKLKKLAQNTTLAVDVNQYNNRQP